MKKVKIHSDINDEAYNLNKIFFYDVFYYYDINSIKNYIYILIYLSIILFIIIDRIYYRNIINIKAFKKYIRDCKKSINYNRIKIKKKNPYISICLSALNMEKYIEKNILSVINQSFQDFEIIIVNDCSNDETENIIKKFQLDDDRIRLISHTKNLGVYHSRIESILNSKSKFILLMDPDDMYLNDNLLKSLYDFNIKNNIDIIEFTVFQQYEYRNNIYYPNNHFETHFHNFNKSVIYQPELSEILYYLPGTKNYSHTICRNIWNKMIRRDLFINMYKYIGDEYYNSFVITADDMIMNNIIYQFARNYTNINLPGYLYIIRKVSMSRGNGGLALKYIRAYNHLFYFKLFYKYLNEYNKDKNFLFYEMTDLHRFIINIKESNNTLYITNQIDFLKKILKDNNISKEFKNFLNNLLLFFFNDSFVINIFSQ